MTETEDSNTSVETRLRELEDHAEIGRLLTAYGRYLDSGDFEAFGQLFSVDAELALGPGMRATGKDAIVEMMRTRLAERVGKVFHIISSSVIHVDGNEATSEVMWTVAVADPDVPSRIAVTGVGRHRDNLVREEGRWLIRRRRGYQDLPRVTP
jgi:uncharacterized protein (TIGR02246 family)